MLLPLAHTNDGNSHLGSFDENTEAVVTLDVAVATSIASGRFVFTPLSLSRLHPRHIGKPRRVRPWRSCIIVGTIVPFVVPVAVADPIGALTIAAAATTTAAVSRCALG